ncbi:MAG: hypothetical protein PF495_03720 [Spirochaetales bacterium]|jgi:hypothetical protein|nr:hypothetical protein [Spirochaetales bacterium]
MKELELFGKKSYQIHSDVIRLSITEEGGHMAPVEFYYKEKDPITPYYINPWHAEALPEDIPYLLNILRGDFFCLPFGENNTLGGQNHPVHGESASKPWKVTEATEDSGKTVLQMELDTTVRRGHLEKRITLKQKETNIYIEHTISGFAGSAPYGHHATLDASRELHITGSPIQFGMVDPLSGTAYTGGEYHALQGGKPFESLFRVATKWKNPDVADCSTFPGRLGFVDVIQMYQQKSCKPAWTTAVCPEGGYLWYAFKNPEVFPSTVMWMENHGRHQEPWNGRNCCIGIEDVCSYFAHGIDGSCVPNPVQKAGIPTSRKFSEGEVFTIRYIQGAIRIPKGFGRVKEVQQAADMQSVTFISEEGPSVDTAVDLSYVLG